MPQSGFLGRSYEILEQNFKCHVFFSMLDVKLQNVYCQITSNLLAGTALAVFYTEKLTRPFGIQ